MKTLILLILLVTPALAQIDTDSGARAANGSTPSSSGPNCTTNCY